MMRNSRDVYEGDALCVIYGLGVPCILRPIMHGEVLAGLASGSAGGLKESWIHLEWSLRHARYKFLILLYFTTSYIIYKLKLVAN
jgi:hypothetical protein